VCRLDTELGQAFAAAAQRAVDELCDGRADLVVSHGQTVFHWVEAGRARGTLQLGQPAWIAEGTGLPVVSDLRARDIAAGGHGAPLVSLLDVLLLGDAEGPPRAALNIGGIANATVVRDGEPPIAFDTGPGNALIDTAVAWCTGGREAMDRDGERAARGRIDARLLTRLAADPYFRLPAPKSTGRELFHGAWLRAAMDEASPDVAGDDLVATVTRLTADTVAAALRSLDVRRLWVSGGGALNPVLMDWLAAALPGVPVAATDELGLPATAKEAYAFALLGFLTWRGVPATLPSCTGARHASLLGTVTPGLHGPAPVWSSEGATTPRRLRIAPR
ncbi:MAG TPA: anhydro-N-acetylmuramic acid kinase, partial [Candidatus Eisenbacteria bacterium]|nr:anhydro-N-acetylmuramic acid kinase [Candidatus Eisenbacteria bacterium]